MSLTLLPPPTPAAAVPVGPLAASEAEAAAAVAELVRFIHATATFDRDDRLWPAHHEVFATNPVGLAHGAAGIALFLHYAEGEVSPEIRRWILDHLDEAPIPPGVYNGAAGVAYVLGVLGEDEAAGALLDRFEADGQALDEAGFLHGLAGWAWANAVDHERTGRPASLARAVRAADRLLAEAHRGDEGWSWPRDPDAPTPLGLGAGAAGVAQALAAVYVLTSGAEYAEGARQALRFEMAHAQDRGGADLQWGRTTEDEGTRPYWFEGGAGIGGAMLRVAEGLGDPLPIETLRRVEEGTRALFTVDHSRLQGMAGLGEFVLDLYHATGDPVYLGRAREMAQGVLCFRVEREEGLAFPSLTLSRLSNDFVTGAAGCGLFLERLATGRSRGLFDLP